VVQYDGVSASLKEHESCDDCSLRQNLQNESNCSEESRKVVSQKEKLLAHIFRGHEERLQILKRMAEKTEEAESHNPVFTFFKSMAQTVTQFPPSITAET